MEIRNTAYASVNKNIGPTDSFGLQKLHLMSFWRLYTFHLSTKVTYVLWKLCVRNFEVISFLIPPVAIS